MFVMPMPLKYALICLATLILNLTVQKIFLSFYSGPFSVYGALCLASFFGAQFKYNMDKRFIFHHKTENSSDNAKKFGKFWALGIVPTAIFWGLELAFYYLWPVSFAKYIGGGIGLVIGHYTKYRIDKRFVFV